MAERPYVAGAVAIGIVAAALHLGTSPAPLAPPSSASSGGAHIRRSIQHPESAFDKVPWAAEMKNHPEYLGKLTAQKEFDDTIDDFYTPPTAAASALEVMIAIEPDPVHTHLSLMFDRDMDALDDALQTAGYMYQSNWLPWSTPSSAPSTGERFTGQEEQHLFLEGRENYPGVILFRPRPPNESSASQQRPLAVFVVGNSPTGGINGTQFEEALAQLKLRAPKQTELRILGPSFSGSGPSLRTLLTGKAVVTSGLSKITIASGSVTDSHCSDFLPSGLTDADGRCVSKGKLGITFVSFGIDKEWRNDQIGAFLLKQGRFKPEEIAELTEDESSYGLDSEQRGNDNEKKYLYLHFPRNISHLRTAYQNSNIFGFGVSAPGAGNVSLNLDLNETSDEDDAIPDFAQQQMPVSQDGIMHEITQILEQHHIKVVMLSASDVLDELFVAEILAREAPNALVVVKQADNLFLRSTSPNDFTDMYFVSPFPLINPGRSGKFIFPSDISEGLYVAARYLYHPEDRALDIPDYGSPGSPMNRPALWLSMVGHGAYWPVALLEDPDSPRRSRFHLPPFANEVASNGGQQTDFQHLSVNLMLLLLCLIALYHTSKSFGLRAIKDFSSRYAINDKDARAPKLFLQLGITLLLLAALQLSISPSYNAPVAKYACYVATGALCLASAHLICLVIALVPIPLKLRRFAIEPTGNLKAFVSVLTIFPLAGVIALSWFVSWNRLWYWISSQSGFPDFFEYRASYPLRGVSPVFPLFLTLVAFCVFLYSHLDRIAFTDSLRPRLPVKIDGLPNCPADCDLTPMTDLLIWPPESRTILGKSALLAVMVALIWTGIKALRLRPRMFDGYGIQRSLGLAMFLLVVAMLWELAMAAVVWHRLKSLCLERLESSSLRRGFSSISGLTWRSLWIFRGSLSSRYRVIQRLLEQTGRGVLYGEACRRKGGASLEESIKTLYAAISTDSGLPAITEAFGAVQKQIAALAGRLLGKLKAAWIKEKGPITACDSNEDEDKKAGSPFVKPEESISAEQLVCEEWVALVYIHYIHMVLLQVRSRLVTGAALYLFLIWVGTCYPYLNRHVLLIALAALLGLLSFAVILIYASINRDPILSRTTNHIPGHLDLDFYLKTASLVGIPLVGFIASQFPEVSGFLFSWLEPGMAAAK